MTTIAAENYLTVAQLDAMLAGGWVIRRREQLPREGREVLLLWHPDKTYGEGCRGPVETFRSLSLDVDEQLDEQLSLFAS